MESDKLRIGNWLVYPNWYNNGKDRYFMARDLYFENDKIGLSDGIIQTLVTCDSVEYIKITPQILLKFGFFEDKSDDGNDVYSLDTETFVFEWICGEGMYLDCVGMDIIYVHELQNLFFALKSKEIILKEKID